MSISFTWIDPDSGETPLGQISSTKVKEFSGLGCAPIQHFLQGIPSQHRQLHRGLKFRPRVVQLALWSHLASATAQDAFHTTLLAALNPDRGSGVLKAVLSDGTTTRYLDCYVQEGPDFASEDRPLWGAHQFYIVRFVALNPFLYNPTPVTATGNFNGATPVDIAVNNAGHIGAFPTIEIAGQVQNPKVELVSTGEYIQFASYTVGSGDHLTVDHEVGTAVIDDGTDKIGELAKASTMFYLPRGVDAVRLTCTAGTSAVTVTWYDQYLGLGS